MRDNDKQRFALRKSPDGTGRWQIRANQGHTIKVGNKLSRVF